MPIVHTTYTAEIKMKIPCLVRCRNCKCHFVYERQFSGVGRAGTVLAAITEASTKRTAETRARDDLVNMLSNMSINDPIPCPKCLHYQPYMFSQVGYAHYDNMGCVCYLLQGFGILALIAAGLYWAFSGTTTTAIGLALTGGIALLIGYLLQKRMDWLVLQFDPNEDTLVREKFDERKSIAKARATLLSEYDTQQTARIHLAYQQHNFSADSGYTDPLTVEWWLPPSVFEEGGTVSIILPNDERFTVQVPSDTNPGGLFEGAPVNPHAKPLQLRLFAMRVHPDETI